jgi:hypothetical protein
MLWAGCGLELQSRIRFYPFSDAAQTGVYSWNGREAITP